MKLFRMEQWEDGYAVLIRNPGIEWDSTIIYMKLTENQAIKFVDRLNGYIESYKHECGLMTEVEWATRERGLKSEPA